MDKEGNRKMTKEYISKYSAMTTMNCVINMVDSLAEQLKEIRSILDSAYTIFVEEDDAED